MAPVWGLFKRLRRERAAALNPTLASHEEIDHLFDEALGRLGAMDPSSPWWKSALNALGGLAVRPEEFNRDHIRQWLSSSDVQQHLKSQARAAIVGAARKATDYDVLLATYSRVSGENRQHAESVVAVALAVLRQSAINAPKDSALAAIVQATSIEQQSALEGLNAKLDDVSQRFDPIRSAATSDFVTREAEVQLQLILRRRASPGENPAEDLRKLLADLSDSGKFASASIDLRVRAMNWLARLEASSGDVEAAQRLVCELRSRAQTADEVVLANIESAQGDHDSALRRLRHIDSPDARSVTFAVLAKSKGRDAALALLDQEALTSPVSFTPVGWRNVCGYLVDAGRLDDAHAVAARLPAETFAQCADLAFVAGIACAMELLPDERRRQVLQGGPLVLSHGLLDGPATQGWRQQAIARFKQAEHIAEENRSKLLQSLCWTWQRVLKLTDPLLRANEVVSIREAMREGRAAVGLIGLAETFNFAVDTVPLAVHLTRQQLMGGLTDEERLAKLSLLKIEKRSRELIDFIEAEWTLLKNSCDVGALAYELVVALCEAKEFGRADVVLEAHAAEIGPEDTERLRLMVAGGQGADPSASALAMFRRTGSLVDLHNLVLSFERASRWRELVPHSRELFEREPNRVNALRHLRAMNLASATASEMLGFLDAVDKQTSPSHEIDFERAWALFRLGRFLEAQAVAHKLVAERDSIKDISLDLNLTIQSGDWDRFPTVLERAWSRRSEFDPATLLTLAQVAGLDQPQRALELAREAVRRAPDDPAVLLAAYSIAIEAGRDDEGAPWMQRAMEISTVNGPIQRYSFRELVALVASDDGREKYARLRRAEVPLHFASTMLNAPLTRLLVTIPRASRDESDARRRQPVPFRAGNRQPIDCSPFKCMALDVTSVLLLAELGQLEAVVDLFDELLVSPNLLTLLLEERKRVVFHQPSRVQEAKPLYSLASQGRLKTISQVPPPDLQESIGAESASLLAAAQAAGGFFVHAGEMHDLRSFMEKVADVGERIQHVTDPVAVALALQQAGYLTPQEQQQAAAELQRFGYGVGRAVPRLNELFLDRVSVESLQRVGLLTPLLNGCAMVAVHESAVQEWQALIDTEPSSEPIKDLLRHIQRVAHRGLASGRVRFLEPRSRDDDDRFGGLKAMPLMDLLFDGGRADAVCIDDRMLNANPALTDSRGRTVPLVCCLDLIDLLIARGRLPESDRFEMRHQLRARCMYCVPLDADELSTMLRGASVDEHGDVLETAALRVVREYNARLHATEVLCTTGDLDFMDSLWRSGAEVIRRLWANDSLDIDEVVAKCDWVATYVIPSVDIAMRFAPDREVRLREIAAGRASLGLVATTNDLRRKNRQRRWVEERQLSIFLPANADVVDSVASQLMHTLLHRAQEIAYELERSGAASRIENSPEDHRR